MVAAGRAISRDSDRAERRYASSARGPVQPRGQFHVGLDDVLGGTLDGVHAADAEDAVARSARRWCGGGAGSGSPPPPRGRRTGRSWR